MKITKIKSMFVAGLLAITMLFACFVFVPGVANADDEGFNEFPDMSEVDTFYYFTDSAEYKNFFDGYGLSYHMFYYQPGDTSVAQNYFGYLDYLNNNGCFSEIQDAKVIIEVSTGLLYGNNANEIENNVIDYNDLLEDIFYDLKSSNCTNMFICSTDECWFSHYSGFLDYVDIHINTDILSVFTYNLLRVVFEDYNLPGSTFIIDADFSNGILNGVENTWFLRWYFFPCLRLLLVREDNNFDISLSNAEIINEYGLKIYCHSAEDWDTYYQLQAYREHNGAYEMQLVPVLTEMIFQSNNEDMFLVEGFYPKPGFNDTWLDYMIEYFEEYGQEPANIFIYGDPILPVIISPSPLPINSAIASTGNIPYIISMFLTDNDLTEFNSYDGRCIISYKDIPDGDGWLEQLDALPEESELNEYFEKPEEYLVC